jgi:DNA processing protein
MTSIRAARRPRQRAEGYTPPPQINSARLRDLLQTARRVPQWGADELSLFMAASIDPAMTLFNAGDLALLSRPCVSIVGTRNATPEGHDRASRLARELVGLGSVIVSGLAKGIDTAAHTSAIESGGRTVAVIGTPLSKAYPAQNGPLQETIWREHLLISPFAEGAQVYPSNFPQRNRVMAAISDATVIVEADDDSGSLHQAVACQKIGRWLFILKSVVDKREWPKRFLNVKNTAILERTEQISDALGLK